MGSVLEAGQNSNASQSSTASILISLYVLGSKVATYCNAASKGCGAIDGFQTTCVALDTKIVWRPSWTVSFLVYHCDNIRVAFLSLARHY